MARSPSEVERLRQEVDRLRQLLQAGVSLAHSVLNGDEVDDDLRAWIAAANSGSDVDEG